MLVVGGVDVGDGFRGDVLLRAALTPPPCRPGDPHPLDKVTGVTGVPAGATVWRVLFHSTTIYGADEAESGYVIAPSKPAPPGGYPIIAWAHGTSGFAAPCAPSLFTSPGVASAPTSAALDRYLNAGYVIAAADYQGLGVADGVHPYLLGPVKARRCWTPPVLPAT